MAASITPSSPLPNLPYSGNVPNASLSASSLRLQSERGFLFNRNRSKSVVQPDSPGAFVEHGDGRAASGSSAGKGTHSRPGGGFGSGQTGMAHVAPGMMREGSGGLGGAGQKMSGGGPLGGVQGWTPPTALSSASGGGASSMSAGMYGSRSGPGYRDLGPTTPTRPIGVNHHSNVQLQNHQHVGQGYPHDPPLPSAGRYGAFAHAYDPYAQSNPSLNSLLSSTFSLPMTDDGMSLPPLPPPPPLPISLHAYNGSGSHTAHSHSSSSDSITSAVHGESSSAMASPRPSGSISTPVGSASQRTVHNMSRGGSGPSYQPGSLTRSASPGPGLVPRGTGPFRGHAVRGSTGSGPGSGSFIGKGKGRQPSEDSHDLPALPSSIEPDETPPSTSSHTPTPGGTTTFPARRAHHSKGSSGQIPEDTFEHDTDQSHLATSNPMDASANARYILAELGRSRDEGDTIDLSKKSIDRVDSADVALLAKVGSRKRGVWRMALSYNRLTEASLDPSFTQLTRLRYLNLKGNNLAAVPPALLNMAGLQILDLSKNQITALPEEPGRLVQLGVLSLTSNRISRLPGYLVYFANLRVLKVEQNPLEWPPPEVLQAPVEGQSGFLPNDRRHKSQGSGGDMLNKQAGGGRKEGEEDMRVWIATIKDWMRDHEHEQVRLLSESRNRQDAEVPKQVEQITPRSPSLSPAVAEENSNQLPPFRMPLSSVIDRSSSSNSPSLHASPELLSSGDAKSRRRAYTTVGERLPELDMSSVSNPSISSIDTSEPSSASSHAAFIDQQRVTLARETSSSSTIRDGRYGVQHNKSSSLTAAQRLSSSSLASKNSLPDLRQDHAKIIADRRSVESGRSVAAGETVNHGLGIGVVGRRPVPPRSPSNRSMSATGSITSLHAVAEEEMPAVNFAQSKVESIDIARRALEAKTSTGPGALGQRAYHGQTKGSEDPKDAYFRRMSTLPPPSTAAKVVPISIGRFVESVRGLLFAFSQVNSALRQYTRYGMTDRVAAILHRAVEPMSGIISGMIGTLDRFDGTSRQRTPAMGDIRNVIQAARDGVVAFAKVVAVLQNQVTALAGAAEHRYTRSFLLAVYGSLGEISSSWGIMSQTMPDIRRAFAVADDVPSTSARHLRQTSQVSAGSTFQMTASPHRERTEGRHRGAKHSISSVESLIPKTSPSVRQVVASRERAKRNAGSFSAEDVQTGMMLGPEAIEGAGEEVIPLSRKPSISLEEVQEEDEERLKDSMNSTPVAIKPDAMNAAFRSFSGSDAIPAKHAVNNSAGSSLGSITALRMGLREAASDVRVFPTRTDDDPLAETLEQTADLAFQVWLTLSEELADSPGSATTATGSHKFSALKPLRLQDVSPKHLMQNVGQRSKRVHDLVVELGQAEEITRALRERLMKHRADPSGSSAVSDVELVQDAEAFTIAVHDISRLVTAVSKERSLSQTTRHSLNRLMAKTRECNLALPSGGHSSGRDPFGPRSGSPAFNGPAGGAASSMTNLKSSLPAAMSGGVAAFRQAMPARSRSANVLPQLGMSVQGRRLG